MAGKKYLLIVMCFMWLAGTCGMAAAAYHHEGEKDSDNFVNTYLQKKGTKLDHCALCHSGGQYQSGGKTTTLGSCQWCHYTYGYDGKGNILETMNQYGKDYHDHGRNAAAIKAIEALDSDGDGYTNIQEIDADRFPGDPNDDPSKVEAPSRIYTKAQLQALGKHSQFLLMNTSRSGDFYAQYTGVPVETLLDDSGVLPSATGILVYAPDGWSQYHPLQMEADPELYHARGVYPEAVYYYDEQADVAVNSVDGWCDYSAPSCAGRKHLDPVAVPGGLKMILAYSREGQAMDPGVLNLDNKLDGEGPFRVVPPQKSPNPPDQSSRAKNQNVIWPYNFNWDHNAGASSRTVTIIKVQPLPAGTTDINVYEAGWAFVDQEKIIIYGSIDGTDSNGNGVLDSEEGTDVNQDFDGDGIPDFQDTDTAQVRQANGGNKVLVHTSDGDFANVQALNADDPAVPQTGKPAFSFPYGTVKFDVVGINPGSSVTVTIKFSGNIPIDARYYKIDSADGWHQIPFGDNDGDETITLVLTDGDPSTDADRVANGTIRDPGAIAVATDSSGGGGGGGGGCFIATAAYGTAMDGKVDILRSFRDSCLVTNRIGSAFVEAYYKFSPPLARFIRENEWAGSFVRAGLLPFVGFSWVAVNWGPWAALMIAGLLLFSAGAGIRFIAVRRRD
ncbi:MAG: hypothetical protein C4582_02725 [Desulfobacteraceae bacterium]|nr:MAG: hypothetical protein C4582_02725 [Desulfobacteraceae bacterium]